MEMQTIILKSKEGDEIAFDSRISELCDTVKSAMSCNSSVTTDRIIELVDFSTNIIKLCREYTECIEYSNKHIIPKPLPKNCQLQNRYELIQCYQNEKELDFLEGLYTNKKDFIELMRLANFLYFKRMIDAMCAYIAAEVKMTKEYLEKTYNTDLTTTPEEEIKLCEQFPHILSMPE